MPLTSRPSIYREDPRSLIESRIGGGGGTFQLSLYRIDASVGQVDLRAPSSFYYGMVAGRQVVHLDENEAFALGSGESLVVPPLQTITVDFPEADRRPVEYVVVRINHEKVRQILKQVDEDPLDSSTSQRWPAEDEKYCYVEYREGVGHVLAMIRHLFVENPPNRDRLIDLNSRQLMIQLLQTCARPLLVGEFSRQTATGGLAAAVQYIRQNLDRHISVDELVEEACMSKSSFYRHFSDEFDMSPLEYISRERVVRARELLSDPENTVTSVSHALGFSSTSHFIDMFKEHEGVTPKQYQLDITE